MTGPEEDGPFPLLRTLCGTLETHLDALETILSARGGLAAREALHDFRVALRRMTAVAKLTRGIPAVGDGDELRLAARTLRRALSVHRTREVCRALLAERFRHDPLRHAVAARLARSIGPARPGIPLAGAVAGGLERVRTAAAARAAGLGALLAEPGAPGTRAAEDRLRGVVLRRLKRKRRCFLKAGLPGRSSLHAARIAAKDLRYAVEFVRDAMPGLGPLVRALQEFQDQAGDAHDRIELRAEVFRLLSGRSTAPTAVENTLLPALARDERVGLRRARRASEALLRFLEETDFRFKKEIR